MAHATTNTTISIPVFSMIGRAFSAFGHWLVRIGEANPRIKAVQALNAMSDEQLAARGLKREDIVRHIFKDVYYA